MHQFGQTYCEQMDRNENENGIDWRQKINNTTKQIKKWNTIVHNLWLAEIIIK